MRISRAVRRGLVGARSSTKCFKVNRNQTGIYSSFINYTKNDVNMFDNTNSVSMVVVFSPIMTKRFYARAGFGSKSKGTKTTVIDEERDRQTTVDSTLTPSRQTTYDQDQPVDQANRDLTPFSSHEEHPEVSQSGLARYMSKVNAWTAGGVLGSLAIASVASVVTLSAPMASVLVGIGASIFSIWKLNSTQPTYTNERDPQTGELVRVSHNTGTRKAYFYGLIAGNGVALSSFIATMAMTNPLVLPKALILSAAVYGVCYLIAKRSKDSTMQALAVPVAAGIVILILTQISAFATFAFIGANTFSTLAWRFDTYVGLAIFTASAVYSNYLAKRSYLDGRPDHLLMAASLYLDFMNILIRIMAILSGNRD